MKSLEMRASYRVENQELFDQKVDEVYTNALTGDRYGLEYVGTIRITTKDGRTGVWTGQHSKHDYLSDYGIVLTVKR